MNTESILHASMLDIIFENRNKEYGAYELRTRYDKRLKKAMIIMFSTVVIFCAAVYVDGHFFYHHITKIFSDTWTEISISKANESKPQELIKPKTPRPVKQTGIMGFVTPRIVHFIQSTRPLPTTTDLDSNLIGPETKPGEIAGGTAAVNTGIDKGSTTEAKTQTSVSPVRSIAEFMPEFPGGMNALQRFLAKNMRVPKDLEPGTKIKVIEKFVVDENGNISAAQTIQSGGIEFDNEVLRVLKKMPKWKPGRQNGQNVAVYFNLPVIFQSLDDN
jgi:periplasmic protein TonB